jgi:hypothetical protein
MQKYLVTLLTFAVSLLSRRDVVAEEVPASSQSGAQSSLDDVVRAWKRREERIRSGRFAWTETRTVVKGAWVDPQDSKKVVPPRDLTWTIKTEWTWEGPRMRTTRKGSRWDHEKEEFLPYDYVSVWDGTINKSFDPFRDQKVGIIGSGPLDLGLRDYFPMRMAYRPFIGFQPGRFTKSRESGDRDGRPHIIVEDTSGEQYWLDPARDFTVARYLLFQDRLPLVRMDISYRQDESGEWVPIAWTDVGLSREGRIEESSKNEVSDYALNVTVEPETFALDFPVGTWVEDNVANTRYIVRENGSTRPITEEEMLRPGITYQDVVESESGMAGLPARPWWSRLTVPLVLAVVAGAIVLIYRRKRGSARQQQG